MRRVTIKVGDKKAISKAAKFLRGRLREGDIILTGPIPLNFKTRFINLIAQLSTKVLKGITHACIYLGDNYVLDTDAKILRSGFEIEKITLDQLISNKVTNFGGVRLYIVTPRHYSKYCRSRVLEESKEYLRNQHRIKHSYWKSFIVGIRYVFMKKKYYPEDLSFKDAISCAEMVAHIYKKAGVKIGKTATYNFVPPQFIFKKYFRIKGKVSVK